MSLRGLTIVVADDAPSRLRTALGMALSQAALGGAARLFLDTAAVPLICPPIAGADDDRWKAGGLPSLAGLVDEALDAGVAIIACQTGLAAAGRTAAELDPRVAQGGMIGLLSALGDDRIVVA